MAEGAYRHICLILFVFVFVFGKPERTIAERYDSDTGNGVEIQAELAEGLPVSMVSVHLDRPTGDPGHDEQLKNQVAASFGIANGATFRRVLADFGLHRVQQLDFVQSVELKLYQTVGGSREIVAAILVSLSDQSALVQPPTKGMIVTGNTSEFPTIFENNRSKFVFILNGGTGVFSDTDPWFGGYGEAFNGSNPTAKDPLGSGTSIWLEGYLEPGIGGIAQLYDFPLYAYGAVSYLLSGSDGHDIYNSGTWGYGDFEKLYAGLIWDLPGENALVDLSVGRQVYQIRDGFLLSKIPVSTSIGERAALYLGPRLSSEFTALAQVKFFNSGLDAFLIEPSEISEIATNTRLAGINVKHRFSPVDAAFTYFYVPESKTVYRSPDGRRLPREGLRTFNPSLSVTDLFGVEGLWLKAEYAYQDHEDYDLSAHAGYLWTGYQAKRWKWQPTLSYRWSLFTGDDPATETFERFDPLFSGGLGNFLPGIVFSKVYKNANLMTNRATFGVKPTETLELTLDYFHHRADDLNNLGGIGPLQTLHSKDIGQEFTLTMFHYIGRNLFLQGIASVGIPGEAVEEAVGGSAETWYTVQAAVYFFF